MLMTIGTFVALIIICQMLALKSGQVVYVMSIKRTSILISIGLGAMILKEGGIKERLTGATVMVSGAIVTAL